MACAGTNCSTNLSSIERGAVFSSRRPSPRPKLGIWRGALAASGRFWSRRRQRQALLELDDRLLADIGITRDQALGEASKPFWR